MRRLAHLATLATLAAASALLGACSDASRPVDPTPRDTTPTRPDSTPTRPDAPWTLRVRELVSGLSSPLYLTAPAGDARLFVLEQPGRIRIVENGALRPAPFLDITAKVSSGGERGLLGLAFHPRYATNGFFYVNYTDRGGDTRVERYRVSADRNVADAASATLVLAIDQPFANHNGGQLAFAPDGTLWIATGDGGGGGDPQGNGQRLTTLLGKLLRVDVDGGTPYAIPRDNPYVGRTDARPEIWALGLRNPWRFSFDRVEQRVYVADVGQSRLEEVDVAPISAGGINWGWNTMEGSTCYAAATCTRTGLRLPAYEYGHAEGCSITGGYVYRGKATSFRGRYFFSDYCTGWLRSVVVDAAGAVSSATQHSPPQSLGNVTSFGEDAAGELYVLSANGRVWAMEFTQGAR